MIVSGQINQTGVIPPELLARRPQIFERVMMELAQRGVHFEHTSVELDRPQ